MIDEGRLPEPLKTKKPSNQGNPLHNHAIFVGTLPIINCSYLITQTDPEICGVWDNDEEDVWPIKNSMVAEIIKNKAPYTAVAHQYSKNKNNRRNNNRNNKREDVSHLTRSRRPYQNALTINEPMEALPKNTSKNKVK
ncbi:hypothetical protein vseg_007542 [Gypsophila vaccaria]